MSPDVDLPAQKRARYHANWREDSLTVDWKQKRLLRIHQIEHEGVEGKRANSKNWQELARKTVSDKTHNLLIKLIELLRARSTAYDEVWAP